MPEYKKPATKQEFDSNFGQIKPLMNDTQAYYESSRCLFCYDAPCVNACPTKIDIPLFIRQINSGNNIGSAKTIYDSNYFGYACGKVCPTEVLCEGACVYNLQGVKPIEIGRLQSFASSKAISERKNFYVPGKPNGKKIAIIGAGPAGISCACELRLLGYETQIFEAKEKPSGLTIYGVAPYKITNEEVLNEMEYLQGMFGFEIKYNSRISSKEDFEKLEKEFDAVFIGIGLGSTSYLKIPGEDLKNCFGAVEFISNLRMIHHDVHVGKNVIVLGGGNTAMDAASESARMGAEKVTLAYRRSKEEMKAYGFEYELAKSVGVDSIFNATPVEITGREKADGVKFVRTKTVNGIPETIPGSEFIIECDMVIKATGQTKHKEVLLNIDGVQFDERGNILANKKTYQTTNPIYFTAGDILSGGQEVVNAAADAKKAAKEIDKYLYGKS